VVKGGYVPDRGDIVWIDFDPQAGHEQAGRRPALVVSPAVYNTRAGLALFCPVTRQVKGYPFEVRFPDGHPVIGVVLSDQVKNLDWRARKAAFHERAPEPVVNEVLDKLSVLVSAD
jgi:mRNA interferase MazF